MCMVDVSAQPIREPISRCESTETFGGEAHQGGWADLKHLDSPIAHPPWDALAVSAVMRFFLDYFQSVAIGSLNLLVQQITRDLCVH